MITAIFLILSTRHGVQSWNYFDSFDAFEWTGGAVIQGLLRQTHTVDSQNATKQPDVWLLR